MMSENARLVFLTYQTCEWKWREPWLFTNIFTLIMGVLTNVALLWLLLREKKSSSASQVLGLNLVVMDLIYMSQIPVNLINLPPQNESDFLSGVEDHFNTTNPLERAREVFSMFNLVGCPLLLTCMCIERYVAVVKPLLYLRSKKWEYRMAVSSLVWCVTGCFCVITGLQANVAVVMITVCFTECFLFIIMLSCLGCLVRFLWKQSPAHTTYGKQIRPESPQKRRAVVNVLAVVVPSVISFFPVLIMAPIVVCLYNNINLGHLEICNVIQLSLLFPNFSVYIGPLFYLSKARQTCCLSAAGEKFH